MLNVQFKKASDTTIAPTKGSKLAAAFDLYADVDKTVVIFPRETQMISTGICMSIPEGYFGAVYARSGLASKNGIRPANCVGVIDADYRGVIGVPLHNDSHVRYKVNPGDRIAQIIIQPCPEVIMTEVNELEDTERGEGGFGSTGQ